ncbi:MAG: T9SS type A sorting domain-containing protein [Flavobacteriales bacterium]
MKKLIMLSALALGLNANAQFLLTNNFSTWDNGTVVGWNGNTTHSTNLTITEVTDGAVFGSSAVQLATAGTQHRRFSSDPVPVEENIEYRFKYFARGKGSIRVGLFDNDLGNGDFGYKYSPYFVLDSQEWLEINQSIIADTTYPIAQFIFSVLNTIEANGHIQIDSVSITSSELEQITIQDIQFTTSADGASPLVDQVVTTGGIVTGIKSNPNGGYFLQAGSGLWSGIYVFDPANVSSTAIGDSIILTGVVEERFGNTQLTNIAAFGKVSSGNNLPAAITAPTGTISSEPYEGILVRAFEATCTAAPNVQNVWTLNDGSGNVFVDDDIYQHTPVVVNSRYNVTGPLYFTFSQFRILPRFPQDVELVQPSTVNTMLAQNISVFPNPASDFIQIQLDNRNSNTRIELMDWSGRVVKSINAANDDLINLNVSDLNQGLYILHVISSDKRFSQSVLLK